MRDQADIVGWLRDQLDEDERKAQAAADAFLHGDRIGLPGLHPSVRRHVYTWTSARVLAEVKAKRLLLDLHRKCNASCYVVKVLALPYSDRPSYRAEWRVTSA